MAQYIPNRLINESSPYLLQHAYNPVNWYPWGKEALEKAENENKLLIISIGYSACHWCHVMEHESFEDETVAAIMNQYFVCIKVDREERPDVDQVYMNAAMIINGNGGWPLNAIALPDGKPVYAGTYYPKNHWMSLLQYFADIHQKDPQKIVSQAQRVTEGIRQIDVLPATKSQVQLHPRLLDACWENWHPRIDFEYGGRQGAPKFMMPNQYEFLLRYHLSSQKQHVIDAIQVSLHKMALGGLYDQLGGGFTRYSTDIYWKVPHFEKMLYDNGQLISLYAQAFLYTQTPLYLQVINQTVEWLEREMKHPSGGYFSALDADSEGVEGKFYCWTYQEILEVVGNDFEDVINYYHCTIQGNWEHEINILHAEQTTEEYAAQKGLDLSDFKQQLNKFQQLLFDKRKNRIRPGLDDKVLFGWNALLLKGFADAYAATLNENYLQKAISLAHFLETNMVQDSEAIWHTWKNGTASVNGFLSDYAAGIEAFIAVYKITFNEKYLLKAYQWLEYCLEHFYDENSGMFFLTSDLDDPLVSRPMEISDNVISSSNAMMARNLWSLGHYFEKEILKEMALQMLENVMSDVLKNGPFYAHWAVLLWEMIYPPFEVAIKGNEVLKTHQQLINQWLPQVLIATSNDTFTNIPWLADKPYSNETLMYVCRNKTCQAPSNSLEKVIEMLSEFRTQ